MGGPLTASDFCLDAAAIAHLNTAGFDTCTTSNMTINCHVDSVPTAHVPLHNSFNHNTSTSNAHSEFDTNLNADAHSNTDTCLLLFNTPHFHTDSTIAVNTANVTHDPQYARHIVNTARRNISTNAAAAHVSTAGFDAQTTSNAIIHRQTSGTSTSLPPHLVQIPSVETTPMLSYAGDIGLDLYDFVALGSAPASNSFTSSNRATAGGFLMRFYDSPVGTGVLLGVGSAEAGAGMIGVGRGSRQREQHITHLNQTSSTTHLDAPPDVP